MKSLKDFKKIKNRVVIPLGIKGSEIGIDSNFGMPKVTVGVGIKVQSYLPKFPYENFDLYLIDGEINLLLTQKGEFTVRVRSTEGRSINPDPKYLDKVIDAFKRAILEYGKM